MNNNYNGRWEQDMLVAVKKSIDETKARVSMELEAKRAGVSVINQSVGEIDNAGFMNVKNPFAGNQKEKNNVRVRTMDSPNGLKGYSTPMPNNYNDLNKSYNATEDTDNRYGTLGSATTLILIFIAILVVLVVGVSFMIMNFVGL